MLAKQFLLNWVQLSSASSSSASSSSWRRSGAGGAVLVGDGDRNDFWLLAGGAVGWLEGNVGAADSTWGEDEAGGVVGTGGKDFGVDKGDCL